MKRFCFYTLVVGVLLLVPGKSAALDIADFLNFTESTTWEFEGSVTVLDETIPLTGTITSQIVDSIAYPGQEAVQFQLLFQGGIYSFSSVIIMRLTDAYLWIEYRTSILTFYGSWLDWDEEIYAQPAGLLPHYFDLDTHYPYIAMLTSGAVSNAVDVGIPEMSSTTQGWEVEVLPFHLFTEDDHPLSLGLARGIGFIDVEMQMNGGGFLVFAQMKLVGDPESWNPDSVKGQWDDTLNLGDGWRSSDVIGEIWTPDINADWIYHCDLDWIFCLPGGDGLRIFVPEIGWLWTSSTVYPIFYDYNLETFVYCEFAGGKIMFFDLSTGTWITP